MDFFVYREKDYAKRELDTGYNTLIVPRPTHLRDVVALEGGAVQPDELPGVALGPRGEHHVVQLNAGLLRAWEGRGWF